MLTKDLPEQVTKLKIDLKKRIEQFNKETGLTINGVMAEALFAETRSFGADIAVVKGYQIGVSIEL